VVPENVQQLIYYNLFREGDERMVSRRVLREQNMTVGRVWNCLKFNCKHCQWRCWTSRFGMLIYMIQVLMIIR